MTRSPSRRYLALWLPALAEDGWRRAEPPRADAAPPISPATPPTAPVVFVERVGGAARLTAVTRAAAAAGLAPGLTLADARARVPTLATRPRDRAAEAALLARAVALLGRHTPSAMAEPPDGAVADIAGCAWGPGGEPGLRAALAADLAAAGLTARAGGGATPEAARARARFADDDGPDADLATLPVEAIGAPPEVARALRRAGIVTVGDAAARPRASLAARFGDLGARLARLLGEEDRRIVPVRAAPPIAARRRFPEPIGRVDDALACLAELAAAAAAQLGERHLGGRCFVARLHRCDGRVMALAVETGRPTRDAALVVRLIAERIGALADPIDPGFGFDMVRLDVTAAEPLAPAQPGLADGADAGGAGALVELVDRLATRFGAAHVRRVGALDSHLPECGAVAFPAQGAVGPPGGWPAGEAGEPPLRPLTLFDPPERIEAVYDLPDGPPHSFAWRRTTYRVARWEGPERIAPEWWRRRIAPDVLLARGEREGTRDGRDRALPLPLAAAGRTRDYYRVEDETGHRFWLFRHGLQGEERAAPDWYLHGLFA